MTDPRRLREDASGLEQDLLLAGAEDGPPAKAKDRAVVALGFATGTAVTTGAATAGATTAAAKVTVLGMSVSTAKILGVCIASSAIAAVAVRSVTSHTSTAPRPVVVSPSAATPVASAMRSAPSAAPVLARPSLPEPVPDTNATPPASAAAPVLAAPAPVRAADVASSHPAPATSMSDELALLDLARAAYRSGDPARTLTLLKEHDEMFPTSPLALESQVLRIDALAAAGRTGEALDAADRFLAAHPNEPLSRHVQSLAERLRGRSIP